MQLKIAMMGIGGHTELSFDNQEVTLEWRETSLKERVGLLDLVMGAAKQGFAVLVGGKPLSEEDLGVSLFAKSGSLKINGIPSELEVKLVADKLITANLKAGKMVMERTENNEWRILRTASFSGLDHAKDGKKDVVISDKPVGG